MSLRILNKQQRKNTFTGVKLALLGPFGIGKTTAIKSLTEPTLCVDLEAGLLAIQDWSGDSISIRTWPEARDIACLIGGPNPAIGDANQPYGSRHYQAVCQKYKDFDASKYKCVFIDSLTVASRLCFQWAKRQPEAQSERTGKPDTRAAYGVLGAEMMAWLNQWQHIAHKDVILVGILEPKLDEFNRTQWFLQCEGSKITNELPGILDQVISMVESPDKKQQGKRVFVCHTLNPWQYPAKDRSGVLDMVEPADLGKLLQKIKKNGQSSPTNHSEQTLPASHQTTNKGDLT